MKEEKNTQILRTWKTTEKNKPENDRKNFESQEEIFCDFLGERENLYLNVQIK